MICNAVRIGWARRLAFPLMALSLIHAHALSAQSMILPEGLTISLETRQDLSSKSAKKGDVVDLAVAKAVTIGGVTLIAAGTPVTGEVASVRDNGLLGRSGKLDIRVNTVKVGQQDVPVRGDRNAKGRSGTLGSIGAGIVFLPLAILVRGKDVKLPAGTTFEVYVDKEVAIGPAMPAPMTSQAAAPPPSESRSVRAIDPNDALTP